MAVDERDLVATLVARAQAGDRAAMGELLRVIKPLLDGVAARMLRQRPHDAEDAVQEAVIAIIRRFPTYDPTIGPFGPWAAMVARNSVLDLLRGTGRRRDREDRHGRQVAGGGRAANAVEDTALADFAVAFEQALEGLPTEQRRALAWTYVFDAATVAELERAMPEARYSVGRWLKKDLARIYDLLGGDAADDPSEGGSP